MPLAKPALMTIALFQLLFSWNDFLYDAASLDGASSLRKL